MVMKNSEATEQVHTWCRWWILHPYITGRQFSSNEVKQYGHCAVRPPPTPSGFVCSMFIFSQDITPSFTPKNALPRRQSVQKLAHPSHSPTVAGKTVKPSGCPCSVPSAAPTSKALDSQTHPCKSTTKYSHPTCQVEIAKLKKPSLPRNEEAYIVACPKLERLIWRTATLESSILFIRIPWLFAYFLHFLCGIRCLHSLSPHRYAYTVNRFWYHTIFNFFYT